jgi:hypothetical protein
MVKFRDLGWLEAGRTTLEVLVLEGAEPVGQKVGNNSSAENPVFET